MTSGVFFKHTVALVVLSRSALRGHLDSVWHIFPIGIPCWANAAPSSDNEQPLNISEPQCFIPRSFFFGIFLRMIYLKRQSVSIPLSGKYTVPPTVFSLSDLTLFHLMPSIVSGLVFDERSSHSVHSSEEQHWREMAGFPHSIVVQKAKEVLQLGHGH